MIYIEWSAVSGYISHVINDSDLEFKPLNTSVSPSVQKMIDSQNHAKNFLSQTLGVPRHRASKGNHKWKLAMIQKELKRKTR
jgi:hypothetical protein